MGEKKRPGAALRGLTRGGARWPKSCGGGSRNETTRGFRFRGFGRPLRPVSAPGWSSSALVNRAATALSLACAPRGPPPHTHDGRRRAARPRGGAPVSKFSDLASTLGGVPLLLFSAKSNRTATASRWNGLLNVTSLSLEGFLRETDESATLQ